MMVYLYPVALWLTRFPLLSHCLSCLSFQSYSLCHGCSLVDCFLVDTAAVSLSLSPTGNVLASAHVDSLGIYLW